MRILVIVGCLSATFAAAQCSTDVECKGDRICVKGSCTAPSEKPADGAPSIENLYRRHWAGGAAVMGFVTAPLVVLAGVSSMLPTLRNGTNLGWESLTVHIVASGLGALLVGLFTPLVALGAGSARYTEGNTGLLALRIAGWACFGLSLAGSVTALILGVSSSSPSLLMGPALMLGAVGLLLHAIDALGSAAKAPARPQRSQHAREVLVLPQLAFVRGSTGDTAPVIGLVGVF